ncbi:MAG: glutamine-hydrolyzing GMP synthase, partial [Flavobacteriales bacterium]|nr:glutamine-hydrolyzing GMP synthase [Flavobacteriales bacterium]
MSKDLSILILDFGSQYTQLIARKVRETGVYCEIHPFNKIPDLSSTKGVILSGSPASCLDDDSPEVLLDQIVHLPILAICYGAQKIAKLSGGVIKKSSTREYGRAKLRIVKDSLLLKDVAPESTVWMSHGDTIEQLPSGFSIIASTEDVNNAAYYDAERNIYGVQFHPEVHHSQEGKKILSNFVFDICKCNQNWSPDAFVESTVTKLQGQLSNDQVVLGLSGGVDSSVAAILLSKAIGDNLHCIFVDNGLLRYNEFQDVLSEYEGLGLNVKGVDARDRFYKNLKGTSDPEHKRKIIGN